jgi:hypothetical protein
MPPPFYRLPPQPAHLSQSARPLGKSVAPLLSRMVAAICRKHEAPSEPPEPPEPGTIWTGPVTNASPTVPADPQWPPPYARTPADPDASRIARESRIAAAGRRALAERNAVADERIRQAAADLTDTEHSAFSDPFAPEVPDAASLRAPDATIDDDIQRVVPYGMEPGKRTDCAIDDSATVAYAGYRRPGGIASARAGQDWTGLPADLRSTGRAARAGLEDAGDGGHGGRFEPLRDFQPGIFDGMPAAGVWQSDWQEKAIEAAKRINAGDGGRVGQGTVRILSNGNVGCSRCGRDAANLAMLRHAPDCTYGHLAAEQRVIAHRVESDAECRTRLLAEWEALAARAPMQAGTVPGEPAPRTEAELVMQAASLARGVGMDIPWNLLFSMGLTVCHQDRRPVYAEHDGNRLVKFMVRQAKEIAAEAPTVPQLSPLPPIQWVD